MESEDGMSKVTYIGFRPDGHGAFDEIAVTRPRLGAPGGSVSKPTGTIYATFEEAEKGVAAKNVDIAAALRA